MESSKRLKCGKTFTEFQHERLAKKRGKVSEEDRLDVASRWSFEVIKQREFMYDPTVKLSKDCKDFVDKCIKANGGPRPTAQQALDSKWMKSIASMLSDKP